MARPGTYLKELLLKSSTHRPRLSCFMTGRVKLDKISASHDTILEKNGNIEKSVVLALGPPYCGLTLTRTTLNGSR